MFIGHFAVGFASKRVAPKASLGVLIAAPILLDLIWPIFLLLGWEQVRINPGNTKFTPLDFVSYPISHSLVTAIGWSVLFGLLYWGLRHYKRGAVVITIGVFSHWILDVIVHRPDMPIAPGMSLKVGLGLWNSVPATIILESFMFVTGVWIYWRMTKPVDRTGTYGFWGFVIFLAIAYVASILSPPPPSVTALAWGAMLTWLLPFWAAWFNRHRVTV